MKISAISLYSLCFLLLSLGVQGLYAQMGMIGQYPMLLGHYNAASIGLGDELSLTALHTRQLEGVEGSSKAFVVMADMPLMFLGHRHGVGVELTSTTFGLFKDTSFAARYAFGIGFGQLGRLQVGASMRLLTSVFDGTKIFVPSGIEGVSSVDDAIPAAEVSGRGIDAQIGAYYRYRNIDLGIGVNNLLGATILLGNKYKREHVRSYNLFARYAIGIDRIALRFEPSVIFEATEALLYRLDLRLGVWYKKLVYMAGMYRPGQAWGANLGVRLGKVYLGYQFERPTSELGRGSLGNHELLLCYSMPIDLEGKKNKKHKSIQLL